MSNPTRPRDCATKVLYQTAWEAEDAYHRTPNKPWPEPGALLPYWCEKHGGFHLGHFDSLGRRALAGWGAELYGKVNAYARVHRKKARRRQAQRDLP